MASHEHELNKQPAWFSFMESCKSLSLIQDFMENLDHTILFTLHKCFIQPSFQFQNSHGEVIWADFEKNVIKPTSS